MKTGLLLSFICALIFVYIGAASHFFIPWFYHNLPQWLTFPAIMMVVIAPALIFIGAVMEWDNGR